VGQHHPLFLYLTTIGWKTGKQHRIEIWFVNYNDKFYVISEREHAHWVQNIMHDPRISFAVNYETWEGTARVVHKEKEPKLAAEVSNLMGTKYGWNEGLIVELIPH
jgi:deazaflavin-dependent oxidoreductase (nitroreductase family)